jgi:diguanylate cyclase (GGDEF)-like protein
METTDTGLPPRFSGLVPAGTDGTGHDARHRHPRVSAGSGAETPGILADGLPTLARVHGVVRLPAWDLAVEYVDEALDSGAVPSLERLARPAQLGSLPCRAFYAQLSLEAARVRRYRGSVALGLFDLDRSEEEDRDRLRRAFAAALKGSVRETDVAGRVGADEFAALLPAAGPPDADSFVGRLRRELPDDVSVSAGTACFPDECPDAEQLLRKAERPLHSEKAAKAA